MMRGADRGRRGGRGTTPRRPRPGPWWGVVAAFATAGLLAVVGMGVVAQARHQVVSEGNTLTSGTVSVGPGLEVALAVDGSCARVDWSAGPVPALVLDDVDLGDPTWSRDGATLCLRNQTSTTLDLLARATGVADLEVGACEPGEASGGDTTCLDGDPGELARVVLLGWTATGPRAAGCRDAEPTDMTTQQAGVSLGRIRPGAVCSVAIGASLADGVSTLQSQTDRLRWDAVVTGEDAEATS